MGLVPSGRRSGWPAKPHFPAAISMTRHGTAGFFRVWRSHPSSASDLTRVSGISRPAPCLPGHPRLEHGPTKGPETARHGAWRGGRVVECTALEMRHRCKPIGGSNPSLSAMRPTHDLNIHDFNKIIISYFKLLDVLLDVSSSTPTRDHYAMRFEMALSAVINRSAHSSLRVLVRFNPR